MLSKEVKDAIQVVARTNGLDPAKLAAVVQVESDGIIFWQIDGKLVPTILTEAVYFYRLTQGETRKKAIEAGLASPMWRRIPYPRTARQTWDRYERMRAIDPEAAAMSCSWGVGQVMGDKWKGLGYSSVQDFVDSQNTLEGQLTALVKEIDYDHLRAALSRGSFDADSWRAFAKGYNGAGYARNNYHAKIAAAYSHYAHYAFTNMEPVQSPAIKLIQEDLEKAGYWHGAIDGVENGDLIAAIKLFQAQHDLVADGIYGALTSKEMADVLAEETKTASQTVLHSSGAVAISTAASQQVAEVLHAGHGLHIALGAAALVGTLAVVLAFLEKHRQATEEAATVLEHEAKPLG
jgi:hypothetical protein